MPIAAVTSYVKSLLDGLPMPGGLPDMVAYIMPPDPNVEAEIPTAYVWPTDGQESRDPAKGGTLPRNSGPGTPSGWKSDEHMVDVFVVWFQADDDPQADSLFPGIVDAVMAQLRTSEDSAALTDPDTGTPSTLYNLGEDQHYQIVVSAVSDQAWNRLDGLIRCNVFELFQA